MEYYTYINDEQNGPYTKDQIQNMLAQRTIDVNTQLWSTEYGDWILLGNTDFNPSLFSSFRRGQFVESDSQHVFFTFIRPYLNFIDNGDFFKKPFSLLYTFFAVIQLIIPFAALYGAIEAGVFRADGAIVFGFILIWIVICFAGWASFQLWWDRRLKITFSSEKNSEFTATPVLSHFIQTWGEWLGSYIAFVGFFLALFSTLFAGDLGRYIPMAVSLSFSGIVLAPLLGFFIIVFSRFIAEQIKALSAIANNTNPYRNIED